MDWKIGESERHADRAGRDNTFLVQLSNSITRAITNLENIDKMVAGQSIEIGALKENASQLRAELHRIIGQLESPDGELLKLQIQVQSLVEEATRDRARVEAIRLLMWGGFITTALSVGVTVATSLFHNDGGAKNKKAEHPPLLASARPLNVLHDATKYPINLRAKERLVSKDDSSSGGKNV